MVTLIVRGHGHDGAGAVGVEHVVGNPDGHLLSGQRVDCISAREEAGLVLLQLGPLEVALG